MVAYGSGLYGAGIYPGTTFETASSSFVSEPIVLVEIQFDSGTRYFSQSDVRFSTRYYEGRVKAISQVRRALQRNLGLYEVASIEVELADTDLSMAQTVAPIKGARAFVRVGFPNLLVEQYETIFRGKIDDFTTAPGVFSITIKDDLLSLPEYPDTGYVDDDNFPNALNAVRGAPLPICYGSHSVTISDDYRNRGAWPTIYVDNTSNSKKFLISAHAVKTVGEVYVNKPSTGSTLMTLTTDYTVQTAGTLNGQTMAWIEFTDDQFNGVASTGVVDVGGVVGDVRVNVDGKEDSGAGTGTLIENPVDVLVDFISHYLGNPPLDSTNLAAVRASCADRSYVTVGGYTVKRPTQNVLGDISRSFNLSLYLLPTGEISATITDLFIFGDVEQSYEQARDIFMGSWQIDRSSQVEGAEDTQVINHVDYFYSNHWAKGEYFSSKAVDDSESITTYGKQGLSLELPWAGSQNTALDVASRIIFQFKQPVPHATFSVSLKGMLSGIAESVSVTHDLGPKGVPWTNRTLQVLSHAINPMAGIVQIRGRDVFTIMDGAYFLGDDSAIVDTGTAGVVNGFGVIAITGGPASLITAGVQVDDIVALFSTAYETNRIFAKVISVTPTLIVISNTTWTTESSISYAVYPSWLTSTAAQQEYGHLCTDSTGLFSDGDTGFKLK